MPYAVPPLSTDACTEVMKNVFILILGLLAAIPCVSADDINVLLIGNSYTSRNGLQGMLRSMLAEDVMGTDQAQVYRSTSGGANFTRHLANADGSNGNVTLRQYLVTDPLPLNFVVLQDQSQTPGFYDLSTIFTDSLNAVVELDDTVEALGAQSVFFNTWGRRNGDSRNAFIYADFTAMQTRLDEGYARYVTATSTPARPTVSAPVGSAFQLIHDAYLNAGLDPVTANPSQFLSLYESDGSHPSRQGSYLSACVLYATLTQQDPRNLAYTASGITAAERDLLRAAAANVVLGVPSTASVEAMIFQLFANGFE